MSKTKDRIKATALELFNQHGVGDTTLRMIAGNLSMSQGNLNYHFKTRQDLVRTLYYDLVALLDAQFSEMGNAGTGLSILYQLSYVNMDCLYRYRFFLRDFYKIMREDEEIRAHYQQLQVLRTEQFKGVFAMLIQQSVLRSEEFEGEFARFYLRMNIIGDNWINAQELLMGEVDDPVGYYRDLLFEMIYPYLTFTGKREYLSLIKGDN